MNSGITNVEINVGINVAALDNLIIEINDYAERIKNILINFDDIVQENIQFFDCDSKEKFLAIHNENKYNYSIFEKNILSYASDLMAVKKNWQKGTDNIAMNLSNHNNQIR